LIAIRERTPLRERKKGGTNVLETVLRSSKGDHEPFGTLIAGRGGSKKQERAGKLKKASSGGGDVWED